MKAEGLTDTTEFEALSAADALRQKRIDVASPLGASSPSSRYDTIVGTTLSQVQP